MRAKQTRQPRNPAKLVAFWDRKLKACGLPMDRGRNPNRLQYAHELSDLDLNRVAFMPNPGEGMEVACVSWER